MDLHIHTPGSNDYQQPEMTGLDILRQAVLRGLDIIALTDHNTAAGYAAIQKEIERLVWLEELGRIEPLEQRKLDEYRRLLDKLLVLPGFEFTATFGFHILGIFPPETPVSFLEHLLLTLNVPPAVLRTGSQSIGATSDVLTAYRVINEAGGLAIAAHANSANGVVMRGLDFGGQTRIAYTQDPNLLALEVTDLDKRGRYTTRRFFDGSKPEYPRPMRCIQGSDAHRLVRETPNSSSLGVGDRITEILLEEVSFEALAKVLRGNDHSLTRSYRGTAKAIDFVQVAREEGESLVQSFHASMAQRGGHMDSILRDVAALANTNGGTIYVGLSADPNEKPEGIKDPTKAVETLENMISKRFSPEPTVEIDSLPTQGVKVVRINVQAGPDVPYAIDYNQFYVRDEDETTLAVRDEIVNMIEKSVGQGGRSTATPPEPAPEPEPAHQPRPQPAPSRPQTSGGPEAPRTGVEIVESQKRDGTLYHTLRDMRNGNVIKNVTRSSARRLWHYAITQAETTPVNPATLKWRGKMAIVNIRQKGDTALYDLAMRDGDGVRVFYGVSESGLGDAWVDMVEKQAAE
jgi:PHP family Zn ribbon phosphoesterase